MTDFSECQWFHECHAESVAIVDHPTIGEVEICQVHLDWITTDPSPTKMVPPLAAKHAAKVARILQ